jgi:hypothetical protein
MHRLPRLAPRGYHLLPATRAGWFRRATRKEERAGGGAGVGFVRWSKTKSRSRSFGSAERRFAQEDTARVRGAVPRGWRAMRKEERAGGSASCARCAGFWRVGIMHRLPRLAPWGHHLLPATRAGWFRRATRKEERAGGGAARRLRAVEQDEKQKQVLQLR